MFEELPGFDVCQIHVRNCFYDVVNILEEKLIFKTKQDLFDVLLFYDEWLSEIFTPYEYLSTVHHPAKHDMSWLVKQVGCMQIYRLSKNLNIDCIANGIVIDYDSIYSMNHFSLGTEKFF